MTESNQTTKIRLDKWLWFARQVRTRSLAQKMISGGKVRVNAEKISVSKRLVGPGDVLTIALPRDIKILKIIECGTKRGPYQIAQTLYEDLSPPKPVFTKNETPNSDPVAGKRPNKRDRKKAQIIIGKAQ